MNTPYQIGIKRYNAQGTQDAHGNTREGWDAPVFVNVYAIAPSTSDEPYESGRTAVVTGLTILAPKTVTIDRRDRVIVDGDEYSVEGEIADWNRGPFGFEPGISINVERVEG